MNTTQKLDQITHTLLDELHAHPVAQRFYTGDTDTEEYVAFLVQTYHYVVHTRPLLRRSGERLEYAGKSDLARLFFLKAEEENGHEHWVLDDLRALGRNAAFVHNVKPVPAIAAYIAWNSYTVEHGSPVAFLGAAYILEAISAARAGSVAKNLITQNKIHRIANAVKFLSGHAEADIEHIVVLGRAIEAFATTDLDREEIITTATITKSSYLGLFTGLTPRSRSDSIALTCP